MGSSVDWIWLRKNISELGDVSIETSQTGKRRKEKREGDGRGGRNGRYTGRSLRAWLARCFRISGVGRMMQDLPSI